MAGDMVLARLTAPIEADISGLRRGLGQARGLLEGFSGSINRVSSLASTALAGIAVGGLTAGIGAVTVGLYKGVQGASDLTETLGKVGVTFGPSAGVVTAAADEMAAKFGTVKQSFLDAASGIGLIAQGSGLTRKAAADLSVELARLGDDAASFFNVSSEDALAKIKSGLVGESEPLRAFGVLLSEAAVGQEALRLGLTGTTKELSEQAKVLARASLIKKGLAPAQGDRARTQGSSANRQREIAGRTTNALTEAGLAIAPIWSELLNQVNSVGVALGGFFSENKASISAWAQGVVGDIRGVIAGAKDLANSFGEFLGSQSGQSIREGVGAAFTWLKETVVGVLGGIGSALETAGFALRNWDAIARIAGIQAGQALTDVGARFGWLQVAAGSFLNWFSDNWKSIFADALRVVLTYFGSFMDQIRGQFEQIKGFLSDPLHFQVDFSKFDPVAQFNKVVDDLSKVEFKTSPLVIPRLELDHAATDRQIAEITAGIGRREADRAARKGAAPTEAAGPGAAPAAPTRLRRRSRRRRRARPFFRTSSPSPRTSRSRHCPARTRWPSGHCRPPNGPPRRRRSFWSSRRRISSPASTPGPSRSVRSDRRPVGASRQAERLRLLRLALDGPDQGRVPPVGVVGVTTRIEWIIPGK
jgi:hypothetical protein